MKLSIIMLLASFTAAANTDICSNYGCPTGGPPSNYLIERQIYVLSNNRTTKFADWVAYKVSASTIDGPSRSRRWKSDPSISSRYTLEPADYKDAWATIRTDRGHQVPLASFSNTPYWTYTNYLSNITPQSSNLNQGPWAKLENAVRNFARTGENAYVVTGPLYEYYFATLPASNESHTIPSGYFKVVISISGSEVKASAFIMEQTADRYISHCTKEVTIDEIERRSGLNLLPNLPAYIADDLESRIGRLTSKLGC